MTCFFTWKIHVFEQHKIVVPSKNWRVAPIKCDFIATNMFWTRNNYHLLFYVRSQESDFCIHAWSNPTSLSLLWVGGKQKTQSVGALLPHHSARSYDSDLAQEKELCVQRYGPNESQVCFPKQHACALKSSKSARPAMHSSQELFSPFTDMVQFRTACTAFVSSASQRHPFFHHVQNLTADNVVMQITSI
jgi:hypothetical protein